MKEKDQFVQFHLANWGRGAFIHIPVNSDVTIPINTVLQESAVDHILIIADPGSKATIIDTTTGKAGYYSKAVEIIALLTVGKNGIIYIYNRLICSYRRFSVIIANNSTYNIGR